MRGQRTPAGVHLGLTCHPSLRSALIPLPQFSLGLSSTRPLLGPGLLTLCAAYKLPEITFFTQVERAEHLHVQFRTQPFPPQRAYKVSKNSSGHFRFYKTETYLETYLGLK